MMRADLQKIIAEWDGQPGTKGLAIPVLPEFLLDRLERFVRGQGERIKRVEALTTDQSIRIGDLIEANNRYLQEARDARAEVRALETELRILRNGLKVKH